MFTPILLKSTGLVEKTLSTAVLVFNNQRRIWQLQNMPSHSQSGLTYETVNNTADVQLSSVIRFMLKFNYFDLLWTCYKSTTNRSRHNGVWPLTIPYFLFLRIFQSPVIRTTKPRSPTAGQQASSTHHNLCRWNENQQISFAIAKIVNIIMRRGRGGTSDPIETDLGARKTRE